MAHEYQTAKLERLSHEINLEELELEHKSKKLFTPREYSRSSSVILPNIFDFKSPPYPPPYFAIDIDNTFFHKDEQIFNKNLDAFIKVRNMGYQAFLCTARPLHILPYLFGEKFFQVTGYRGFPGVYLNGSVVYDKRGNLVHKELFEKYFLHEIIDYIVENKLEDSFLFLDIRGGYSLKPLNDQVSFILRCDGIPLPEQKTAKEMKEMDIISIVASHSRPLLKKSIFGREYIVRNIGLEYLVEYSPNRITKADGISILMKHENLKPESCGFIGDGDNDVEGMELCDLSFAVANATNYVKRHAKWILHLNYYDGAFSYVMNLVYKIYTAQSNQLGPENQYFNV